MGDILPKHHARIAENTPAIMNKHTGTHHLITFAWFLQQAGAVKAILNLSYEETRFQVWVQMPYEVSCTNYRKLTITLETRYLGRRFSEIKAHT